MRDFTLSIYRYLLKELIRAGYKFLTVEMFFEKRYNDQDSICILRHDVDALAANSLRIAKIETGMNVCATYYFRYVPASNKPDIIKQIAKSGHEIGYHYEDMCVTKGNHEQAYELFEKWLAYFRRYYPVKTICMHGSPRCRIDPKELWRFYDYRTSGIIGEPYLDIDFNEISYLTDTGRCWNGDKYSVRDKVDSERINDYHNTCDIIQDLRKGLFPKKVMITTHPQRWTDNRLFWLKEIVTQNIKNIAKRLIVKSGRR